VANPRHQASGAELAEGQGGYSDAIIASVQHVDVVRNAELAAEREAKRQMDHT